MTYETCERLAKHCREMEDEAGALMYEERVKRKKIRLGILEPDTPDKPEVKSDGKKSKR